MSRLIRRWSAAALLEALAWCLALVIAAGLPALLCVVDLQYQRGTLASIASSRAVMATQRVTANPQMWRFEVVRLRNYVDPGLLPGDQDDRRSIVDEQGRLIVENRAATALAWPTVAAQAPLHDAGRVVGAFVVERSLRPLIASTAAIAALSIGVAALMLWFLKSMPLRALRKAEAELEHKAYHDALTGLHNRDAFRRLLDSALVRAGRRNTRLAVLFINLDRFKSINDTLGHDAGDAVLCAVARRLQSGRGPRDVVARLSGDEFAIIVDGLGSEGDAAVHADAVIAAFETPFEAAGRSWHLSCSVGVSVYPQHAREADKLLAFADTAMLHAKSSGRSARRLYSDEMQESVARRVHIEEDLRGALARGEFELHYQPLWDLAGDRVKGAEALLRWRHPQRGLVPPVEFIGVLEDLGLIHAVGHWVLAEACRQWQAWSAAGLVLQTVAVNVSARQFERGSAFVEQVQQVLADTGIPPARLQLELTEGILMSDSERSLAMLGDLNGLGLTLAIDDFGTGYSSLAYLRSFPVDTLKVDRSFVRAMCADDKDARIVQAIVQLAHSLGLAVTAEGIETAEQLAALRALGCDTGQGYLLGRPQTADALLQTHGRVLVAGG